MAIGFKHGASGAGGYQTNFRVLLGTSAPSDPTENTIWVSTTWAPNGWTFGPEMPLRRSRNKNFVTLPFYSSFGTSDGITYTDLGDGRISASGTASKNTIFRASYSTAESGMFLLPAGTYTMHGCPAGGKEDTTYALQLNRLNEEGTWVVFKYEYGSGTTFTVDKDTLCCVGFRVWKDAALNGLEVYFQIEKGETKTAFEIGNASGQLWFKPGPKSAVSIEALKRNSKGNSIILQPAEVYLFRRDRTWDKAWEPKACKVYQNGEWKDLELPWDGHYYKAGDQCGEITGGWTGDGWISSVYPQTKIVQMNADHIYFEGAENHVCIVGAAKAVDLTDIRTIKADVEITNIGQVVMCISKSKNYQEKVAETEASTKAAHTYSLDVSGYSGSYYILFYSFGSGAKGLIPKAKIMNVWGE